MVDMYPFRVAGFKSSGSNDERVSRTEVVVTSAYRSGVKPKSFLPPSYIQVNSGKDRHRPSTRNGREGIE